MTESVTTARDMMLRIGWEGDEEGFTVTVNVVVSVVVNTSTLSYRVSTLASQDAQNPK